MASKDLTLPSIKHKRQKLPFSKGIAVTRTTVLLVVDGNVEISYFNKLNRLGIFPKLRLKPINGNENTYKIIFKENLDLQHKYLILDIDNSDKNNATRAEKIRSITTHRNYKDIVFFNNYSFETFILNHLNLFARPITEKTQYDDEMSKKFGICKWSKYKDQENTDKIIKLIDENSYQVMLNNITYIFKDDCFANPSSNMHLLFEKLERIQ